MALSQLTGDFGKESMLSLQRFFGARRASVISTGSLKLDMALGIGGLPKVSYGKKQYNCGGSYLLLVYNGMLRC